MVSTVYGMHTDVQMGGVAEIHNNEAFLNN